MKTIPTYKELVSKIEKLESQLEYWSGLASLDEAKAPVDDDSETKEK